MTGEELQEILSDVWHRVISADDAFDLLFSELKDDNPSPPDNELPGMWETADFMGGETDA